MAALAKPSDLIDIWASAADLEQARLLRLLDKASSKLRAKCPFDIDERIATFATDPSADLALDPAVVADRVAIIVKRFLTNPEGLASLSHSVGPFSESRSYVGRADQRGVDQRGELVVTEEDIDELRPAAPFVGPGVARVGIPRPEVLIPAGGRYRGMGASRVTGRVVPDVDALEPFGGPRCD